MLCPRPHLPLRVLVFPLLHQPVQRQPVRRPAAGGKRPERLQLGRVAPSVEARVQGLEVADPGDAAVADIEGIVHQ